MKRNVQKITCLILMLAGITVMGQTNEEASKHKISIEIDPATFVFGGYSGHLRWQPKQSNHWLFGAGIYAMNMPEVLVGLDKNNRNKGWEVRLQRGTGLFAEHHFKEVNKGWFVGTQIGLQEYRIKNEAENGSTSFVNSLLMAHGGYTWAIGRTGLYVKSWGGLGYSSQLSGSPNLGDSKYHLAPLTMFATVHLGYTF